MEVEEIIHLFACAWRSQGRAESCGGRFATEDAIAEVAKGNLKYYYQFQNVLHWQWGEQWWLPVHWGQAGVLMKTGNKDYFSSGEG